MKISFKDKKKKFSLELDLGEEVLELTITEPSAGIYLNEKSGIKILKSMLRETNDHNEKYEKIISILTVENVIELINKLSDELSNLKK